MPMPIERVIAAVESQPWAILPDKLRAIESVLARRAVGEAVSDVEIAAAKSGRKESGRRKPATGVAVIPIYGTITQRADWLSEWSGGTSTEQVGRWLDEAAADPGVEEIVFDVDSPGGSVYGVEELAAKIIDAGKSKKTIAVANSLAASAAYYLASQAAELVVTPGGQVGSIGVLRMHVDVSKAMESSGRKVTYVYAGERKVAGHPYAPLEGVGLDEIQAGVNDYYDQFVRAVARGRGVSLTKVREGFGRGGVVRAAAATAEGMADKVATLEQVLARYGVSLADVRPAGTSAQVAAEADTCDTAATEIRRRKLKMHLRDS